VKPVVREEPPPTVWLSDAGARVEDRPRDKERLGDLALATVVVTTTLLVTIVHLVLTGR
jgi:hypothetical protein